MSGRDEGGSGQTGAPDGPARQRSSVGSEIRHALVLGGGTAAAALLALLYQFVVGHALGPAEFADFATVLSLVYFGAIVVGPVNATAARFSAEFAARGEFGKVHALSRGLARWVGRYGLLGCVVGVIAVRPLAEWLRFHSPVPLALAVVVLYLTLLVNLARGVLRGVQEFGRYNLNAVSEAGLRLLVGIPVVYAFLNAAAAVAAYAVALGVLIPISALQARSAWRGADPDPIDSRIVKRFGLPMILFTLTAAGFITLDMVLVKHLFDSEQAGLYGGAVTLARSINLIYGPFGVMMLPLFVSESVGGGRPLSVFLRICAYFMGLAMIPLLIFVVWSVEILDLTLGSAFVEAAPVLVRLGGASLLAGIAALTGNALAGLDRFGFLVPYTGGLLLEILLLSVWHGSLLQVATIVLIAQAITVVGMILMLVAAPGVRARHA